MTNTTIASTEQGQSDAFKFLDQLPDDQLRELRNAVRKKMKSRGLVQPKAEKAAKKAAKAA